MKKIILLVVSVLFPCFLYADTQDEFKDWLPRMKEIFGDEQPSATKISAVETRELKYPGQRFQHVSKTDIEGKGYSKKKSKLWFDTTVEYKFEHETSFMILEEILSVDEDEDDGGVIKSKFTVQMFNERLKSANANFTFGMLSSKELFDLIKKLGETYRNDIESTANNLILLGVTVLRSPEPKVSKIVGVGSLIGGGAIKLASWLVFDKLTQNVDEDGNIILSDDYVHKYFPECNKVIEKLHQLEGTEVLTTWVSEKGYTQFEIKERPDLTDEDKEWIAKNVFRFNPVGVNSVLPKDKKGKDNVWDIDVKKVFGGILSTTGVSYDNIEGRILIKDCGVSQKEFVDEQSVTGQKETDVSTLMTVDGINDITFTKRFKDNSYLKMNVEPRNGLIVVIDPDAKKGHKGARYVKSVELEGEFNNHIDKPAGLLHYINFEENTVRLKFVYVQLNVSPAKK